MKDEHEILCIKKLFFSLVNWAKNITFKVKQLLEEVRKIEPKIQVKSSATP